MRRHRRDLLAVAGLTLAIVLGFAVAYGRVHPRTWATPVAYGGDAWFVLAYLEAAHDGHILPLRPLHIPDLNAPFEASWDTFLRQHKLQFLLAGLGARRLGLMVTANLLLLLAHVLAGLSFYAVARALRARVPWALAGACAFAFSPFLFWRGLGHLTLAMCWTVPFCVLAGAWAFGRHGLPPRSRRFKAALAITMLAGLHNIYFAALYGQFLLLAGAGQALRRRFSAAAGALLLLAALAATVLFDNANMLMARWREGPNPEGVRRSYSDTERYALKPLELALPPPGAGLLGWGSIGWRYWRGTIVRGEDGAARLGLVGLVGLMWLALATLRDLLVRAPRRMPAAAGPVLWILLFSVMGGLNAVPALFAWHGLRATNRFSQWILAVVLLFLVLRLSRATARRSPTLGAGLAAALTALSWADQVPPPPTRAEVEAVQARVDSDRRFVRGVEAALPRGAMVFQVPVVALPEARPLHDLEAYEHFRPYFFSTGLRFSFGTDKGRRRDEWQYTVGGLPPAEMVRALENDGFQGLLVNRRGFADGGKALLDGLLAANRPPLLESDTEDLVLVRLEAARASSVEDGFVTHAAVGGRTDGNQEDLQPSHRVVVEGIGGLGHVTALPGQEEEGEALASTLPHRWSQRMNFGQLQLESPGVDTHPEARTDVRQEVGDLQHLHETPRTEAVRGSQRRKR